MSAENALGLFVAALLAAVALTWLIFAFATESWPFRAEDEGETEETLLNGTLGAPPSCGLVCAGGSERRGCPCTGPRQCPYRVVDPWSGVDPRHGEDGNAGHG